MHLKDLQRANAKRLSLPCLALLASVYASVVQADVRLADSADAQCDIYIEGEIQSGDAEIFEMHAQQLIAGAREQYTTDPETVQEIWPFTVCLASNGGSYVEGIALALHVQGYFETRLLENAVCASSCAIIFMSGSSDGAQRLFAPSPEEGPYGYSTRPTRVMSPSSQLGFHAPYIDYSGRDSIPVGEVQSTIRGALALTGYLLTETQGNFPLELAQQSLLRGPDELYFVDEVGQLNAWDIGLTSSLHPPLSFELFQRAWVTFAHRYANGTPGYGSVGDPAFGVMQEEPSLSLTSGWEYNTSQGTTESGAPYLLATNIGNEASFGAAFIDYGSMFQLRVLTSDYSEEIARFDIEGWQLVDPRTNISRID